MPTRRLREPPARYHADERTMVDTNVLVDVLDPDPVWYEWSAARLDPLVSAGCAIINPIVYAELATGYATFEDMEAALNPFGLAREPLPWAAAYLAGQAYFRYRQRGGAKRSPLPDFYIGAHASVAGYKLLTRDPKRYREYFPKLKVIAPK